VAAPYRHRLTVGYGSPLVAEISIANAAKLHKTLLDALVYRGTAFFQCYPTCQPEHGVGDDMAVVQTQRARDSRGMPELTFHSDDSKCYTQARSLKGNPSVAQARFDGSDSNEPPPKLASVGTSRKSRPSKPSP